VTSDKFFRYFVEYTYFGLQRRQQPYVLLTEAAFSRCKKGKVAVCPADLADNHSQTLTCEASLFFRTGCTYHLCRRTQTLHRSAPILQRYGKLWIYQFTRTQQGTLNWEKSKAQVPYAWRYKVLVYFGTSQVVASHHPSSKHISNGTESLTRSSKPYILPAEVMIQVGEWPWELIICLLDVWKNYFGEVDEVDSRCRKALRNQILHPRYLKKGILRNRVSNDSSRRKTQRTHNLPNGNLKMRLWWSWWSYVSRPCELIIRILGIQKNTWTKSWKWCFK
jgi:hypothetical protein